MKLGLNATLTVITPADQPATVVHPEMPVQIRRTALPRIRTAPDNDRPADAALGAQRIVSAQVEVRPDSAGVRHSAQAARVRAHPVRDGRVPARRRRRRGRRWRRWRRRQQRRCRRRRWCRRRGWHARLAEIAVLLVLRLLLHRPQTPPDVRRGGRRNDRCAPRRHAATQADRRSKIDSERTIRGTFRILATTCHPSPIFYLFRMT